MRIPHVNALRTSPGEFKSRRLKRARSLFIASLLLVMMATAFSLSPISSAKLGNESAIRKSAATARAASLKDKATFQASGPAPEQSSTRPAASVTTDKTDYQPGETVIITGSAWLAGESVLITLGQEPNVHGETQLTAVADENGDILSKDYATTKDDAGTRYTLTATGQSSGQTATVNFTDGGQFSYSPNTTSLTIQTGPSAASDQFTENITAPGGNGSFQAAPQIAAVPNTTPIPSSWLSFNPSQLNFSTGPAQNPHSDTRSWVVTATVPANSSPGTYVADIQARPNSANVNVIVGQGTRLRLTVLPPAPVDSTPPSSSLTAQDSNGHAYNGIDFTNANKVTIKLSATDPGAPSSGVAQIIYKIDNGAPKTYTGPFDIAAEGINVITYFAKDNAGNQETPSHSFTVRIDKTPPVATAVRDTPANANGWNNTAVQVSYTATDNLSGINLATSDLTPYSLTTEGANQSHTFTVYDNAGNSATAAVSGINIDLTAPSIAAQRDTQANSNGWNNTDVASSYTSSDALSGLPAGTESGSFTFTSEGAGQSHEFTVTDLAGNSASADVTGVNIDRTKPAINASRNPAPNANGWNNTDVTASYTASDALSGLDASSPASGSFVFSTEGAGQSHEFTVTDLAGNSNSASITDVNIDKTAPTATAVRDTAPNLNGWNNTDVKVSYTASDGLSDIDLSASDSTPYTLTAEGGGQSHSFNVYDKAGNLTTVSVTGINIDKTAPTISSSRSPGANSNGWNNTDVLASYTASDALSGLDGSSPATGSYNFTAESANQSHSFTVTDRAGNSASSTVSDVNIDKTKPTISASRAPAANSFGWNNVDVTANYTASDGLSGLDGSSPASGSHLFNTEGANQSHTFTVTDRAGNSNTASITDVSIDKTQPVITITTPADGGSYLFNSSVAANFSTSDALSGLDPGTQTSTTPNGSNINTASVGSKPFTVSVTDKAGNPASKSSNYTVTYAPAGGACGGSGHIILQPVNADGSSVFKKGSTVPAKFRVFDANCNSIGTPGVVTGFVLMYVGSSSNAPVNEVVDSTTPDTVFRWSATDQQWIFNISTKNLTAGVNYFYRVTLNDGSYIDFAFSLK